MQPLALLLKYTSQPSQHHRLVTARHSICTLDQLIHKDNSITAIGGERQAGTVVVIVCQAYSDASNGCNRPAGIIRQVGSTWQLDH